MSDCPVLDDSDGITLNSLGGVFIATLIGLVIALITLGVEVVLQERKEAISTELKYILIGYLSLFKIIEYCIQLNLTEERGEKESGIGRRFDRRNYV